jgi:hypothetical protein
MHFHLRVFNDILKVDAAQSGVLRTSREGVFKPDWLFEPRDCTAMTSAEPLHVDWTTRPFHPNRDRCISPDLFGLGIVSLV